MDSNHSLSLMDMNMKSPIDFDNKDDDTFYADLTRQILLLTADDDEDRLPKSKSSNSTLTSKPCSNNSIADFHSVMQSGTSFSCLRHDEYMYPIPYSLVNAGRGRTGTGVFIPQIDRTSIFIPHIRTKRKDKPSTEQVIKKNLKARTELTSTNLSRH